MLEEIKKKYLSNDDGDFDPNEHMDKFALIYMAVLFVFSIALKAMGII
ncbi:MAG TPA: hypothetical protein VK436_08020 [Methanocella sp.]|nr:hypothetical protein [Methanocella sp.]